MFTSQPSLSRAVARLELQLGVRLLSRGPRGVTLTENGEALVAGARRVLDSVAALRRDVATPGDTTMQIGATATSARSILAPYLARWIPAHPEVRLTAVEDGDLQLQVRLENGDCDTAVISAEPSPAIESLLVASVQVAALFPFGHPLAAGAGTVSVVDLAGQPLLLNGPGFPSTELLLRAIDVAGLSAQVVYECSAGQTLAAMAEAGLGVAVFGDSAPLQGFDLCRRPVADAGGSQLSFNLYIAWKRDIASTLVRDFGVGLATFHRQRSLADGPQQRS